MSEKWYHMLSTCISSDVSSSTLSGILARVVSRYGINVTFVRTPPYTLLEPRCLFISFLWIGRVCLSIFLMTFHFCSCLGTVCIQLDPRRACQALRGSRLCWLSRSSWRQTGLGVQGHIEYEPRRSLYRRLGRWKKSGQWREALKPK